MRTLKSILFADTDDSIPRFNTPSPCYVTCAIYIVYPCILLHIIAYPCLLQEDLTPMGKALAQLPIEPRVGQLVLLGAVFGTLDPVLTIAASLGYKEPFLSPPTKRREATEVCVCVCVCVCVHACTCVHTSWTQFHRAFTAVRKINFDTHSGSLHLFRCGPSLLPVAIATTYCWCGHTLVGGMR